VEGYAGKHPSRIRYIHQPNAGEASATNHAWRVATGKYFCVVCSDDPQPPELVRESVAVLEAHPDVVVSYPDWWRIDAAGRRVNEVKVPEYSLEELVARVHCFLQSGAMINRAIAFPRFPALRDPRYTLVSDYSSWLKLCQLGPFKRVPKTISNWREHAAGASSIHRGRRYAEEYVALFRQVFADPALPAQLAQYRYPALAHAHRMASWCVGRRDPVWWLRYRLQELLYVPPIKLPERLLT
jgi:glycosyltransferase involved in cell wall biosynthesis